MNVLLNRLNVASMFAIQNLQYTEVLYLADSVPAGGQKMGKVAISNLGHFFVQFITGSFATRELVAGAPPVDTDLGLEYLRGKLIDGSNQRPLFNDYIPLSLWVVPGRRKSIAASGSDSFQMGVILPFEYMFTVNSDILLDMKNDSTVELPYNLAFWGVRVKATESTTGIPPIRRR